MKDLFDNIVPICLIILAGFMIYTKTPGWGWCVFGAIITTTYTVYSREE